MPNYRIAVVAACPYPCARGTPLRIQHLAETLARRGHDVHVATYHLGDGAAGDPRVHIHRCRNVPSYRSLAPGPSLQKLLIVDALLTATLARLLRTRSFDLIHAHHFEGLLTALLARGRLSIPIIFDAHTLLRAELPDYGGRWSKSLRRLLGHRLDRSLPCRADHTIAVSEEIRTRLLRDGALDEADVSVIGNGVELEIFRPPTKPSEANSAPTAIFTGNLAPYQGIDLMLRAFALVHAQRPDARLKIVSDSAFGPHAKLAGELGVADAVVPLRAGFEEVPGQLCSAHVALNPRLDCPGVPVKLLNYMAAARPVVSFAGSATHLTDGVNGRVVENGDVQGFAGAILGLMDNPDYARRIGNNARAYAEEHFSWQARAQSAERVYEKVIAAQATRRSHRRRSVSPDLQAHTQARDTEGRTSGLSGSPRQAHGAAVMRVCLLCVEIFAFGKIGGYGRATRIMGRELARRGIQVFAIVPRRGDQRAVEHLDGITVLSFPMSKPWHVMELCRRCDADIYHSQEPSLASYFAQRAMPDRRHVVTIRDPKSIADWLTEVRRPSVSRARTFFARFYDWNPLVRRALCRADRLFSVSHALASKAHRLYRLPQPPVFLPSPIALPAAEPCKSSQPQVCALGRLDPRKRPELFIALAERFPEVRFVMIGGGHDSAREQAIRRRCEGLANLELTGFIDQFTSNRLSEILGRSWVLANTSTREGLPTSFLEGLAHGCALLSELNPDGVVERYGHRVQHGDFAGGLARLLAGGCWQALGRSGRDYVARHYEQERIIERHIEIYRELTA